MITVTVFLWFNIERSGSDTDTAWLGMELACSLPFTDTQGKVISEMGLDFLPFFPSTLWISSPTVSLFTYLSFIYHMLSFRRA